MRHAFIILFLGAFAGASELCAFTANKVWFEFRPRGRFRVTVNYTVPALKEFRESYVEFKDKKEAEQFYWAMVKGAEFYPPHAKDFKFTKMPASPDPW